MSELAKTMLGIQYAITLTDATPADVPIYNKNGLWKEWNYDEIYFGADQIGEGNKGRYVPKVDDKVFAKGIGTFIVVSIDPGLLIPTLERYVEPPSAGATDEDFILGVGPRFPQQGYFVYVDSGVTPPVLAVDGMAYWRQSDISYFRVFVGNGVLPNTEVLSAWYNQSGDYVNDQIEAEYSEDRDGRPAWVPKVAWAKREVQDGELITIVAYSAKGNAVSQAVFTLRNSGMVRQSNSTVRSISSIELVGPNVVPAEKKVKIAVNDNLNSLVFMCRVTYRGGKTVDKAIDHNKIRLVTDSTYIPSSPGINQPLILIYNFDATEAFDGSISSDERFFQETYTVEADSAIKAYGMKLFTYPYWKSAVDGYGLKHFLQSVDRDAVYDVSGLVEISTNSAIFDPMGYGVKQRMTFALDLSKVDPRFTEYRHTQSTSISLLRDGLTDGETNWLVGFENGYVDYGEAVEARLSYVSSQVWTTTVDCGAASEEEWLERLYYRTRPVYNTLTESAPMKPTHFVLVVNGLRYRKPLSAWNTAFSISSGGSVGELAVIHWIAEVNDIDLNLASSGLIIRHIIN